MKSQARNLDDLLTVMAWFMVDWLKDLSPLRVLKVFGVLALKIVVRRMEFPASSEIAGRIVVFQSMFRPDYDEMVANVVRGLGAQAVFIGVELQNYQRGSYRRNSPVGFGQGCSRLWQAFKEAFLLRRLWFLTLPRRGFVVSTFLFLHFIKLRVDFGELLRSQPRSVVVFAEMQPLDRVLSMLCAEQGIPCATMQHGLYAEYLKTETVNRYNYQPMFVNRFLAWGANTKRLVHQYVPGLCIAVCGKPTLQKLKRPAGDPEFDVVVIFDQNIFQEENQAMLDIVRAVHGPDGDRIGVRFHPRNDRSDYHLDGTETVAGDGWLQARCCVGHSSSFLVDVLEAGVPLFRFDSGAESVLTDQRMEFRNEVEYRRLRGGGLPETTRLLGEFIAKRGEPAIDAHCEAILGMNKCGR